MLSEGVPSVIFMTSGRDKRSESPPRMRGEARRDGALVGGDGTQGAGGDGTQGAGCAAAGT